MVISTSKEVVVSPSVQKIRDDYWTDQVYVIITTSILIVLPMAMEISIGNPSDNPTASQLLTIRYCGIILSYKDSNFVGHI
jgi:hypothetical protein